MNAPRPFEPRLVRARKRRAAKGWREAAFLHARSATDLVERLEAVPRVFSHVLALGGGGLVTKAMHARPVLAGRVSAPLETDVVGGAVTLDPEHLPFAPASFDLIVAPLALHWVNDLPGTFVQLRQALKPDGLMLASMFGGETLHELRYALLRAEADLTGGAGPRVAAFASLQDVAHLLQRAGFGLPATDRDVVTVRYDQPMRLLADLRAMGETAALTARNPRGLSRRILGRTFDIYRERFSDADGRIRATFEIINATGWAPHESQQRPLQPGTAKTRLADALGVTEQNAGDKAGR